MTKSRILSSVLIVLLGCTPAIAQNSKMYDIVSRIRNHGQTLEDNVNRRPLDEAKIVDATQRIRDAARTGADLFAAFGEPLAAAAASPFESQLREPGVVSKRVTSWFNVEIIPKCELVLNQLNVDPRNRDERFLEQLRLNIIGLSALSGNALAARVEELQKKSAETQKWLRDKLREDLILRENVAKTVTSLDSSKRDVEMESRRKTAAAVEFSAKFREMHEREMAASSRYYDAFAEYNAAREASLSSSYASNLKNAWEKWSAAQRNHWEASKVLHEYMTKLEADSREARTRVADLGRLMSELQKFQESANPEALARRIADFDRWRKIFEDELSR